MRRLTMLEVAYLSTNVDYQATCRKQVDEYGNGRWHSLACALACGANAWCPIVTKTWLDKGQREMGDAAA